MDIDIAAITRQALMDRKEGEDLDEALLRACKRSHGESAVMVLECVRSALSKLAEQMHINFEAACRQAAEGKTPVRVQAKVWASSKTRVVSPQSMNDLPADVRAEVERAIASGGGRHVVTTTRVVGCGMPSSVVTGTSAQTPGTIRCSRCGYES